MNTEAKTLDEVLTRIALCDLAISSNEQAVSKYSDLLQSARDSRLVLEGQASRFLSGLAADTLIIGPNKSFWRIERGRLIRLRVHASKLIESPPEPAIFEPGEPCGCSVCQTAKASAYESIEPRPRNERED